MLSARGLKFGSLQEQIAKAPRVPDLPRAKAGARVTLESFLGGLKRLTSDELIDYFAENAEFIRRAVKPRPSGRGCKAR